MNYNLIHSKIIMKALLENREKNQGVYYELHHILPKSFFPEYSNLKKNKWNSVLLTGREHFIIHRILAKMFPNTTLVHAPWKMACTNKEVKITARVYDFLRKEHARRLSEDKVAAHKKSLAMLGRKQSEEHKKKRVISRKENGQWHTQETKLKISESNKGKQGTWSGKILPIELVKKRNETRHKNDNYKWTEEQKLAQSKRLIGKKRGPHILSQECQKLEDERRNSKITCPHCLTNGGYVIMKRWHFDNCKKKP